jgi:hypothetical protein
MRLRSIFNHSAKAVAESALVAIVVVGLMAGTAFAGKPASSGGKGGCVRTAPTVKVDNNWAWGQSGSFGLAGQTLNYAIDVINRDAGCGSTTFVVGLSAPSGFTVSPATLSISLKSASSGYVWTTVTAPAAVADGDYPLSVTLTPSGASSATASATSYFKVYSSDTTVPVLFWPAPGDGTSIAGSTYGFAVSSNDDHAVKSIDLYIDGVYKSTTACDNVTYTCQFRYTASLTGMAGQHSATFMSHDWLGNVGTLTVGFTVG